MKVFRVLGGSIVFVLCCTKAIAQTAPPALSAILEADTKRDVYALADDRFRGREAGTLDELK